MGLHGLYCPIKCQMVQNDPLHLLLVHYLVQNKISQLDKVGLACIFGVKRFHLFLYGRNFTLVTDHKPLLQLFDPQRGIPMQVSG